MKRPLLWCAISLIIGIIVADLLKDLFVILLLNVVFAVIALILSTSYRKKLYILLSLCIFFAIGSFQYFFTENINNEKYAAFEGKKVTVTGYINSEADIRDNKVIYVVRTEKILSCGKIRKVRGKIQLTTLKKVIETQDPAMAKKSGSRLQIYEYGTGIQLKGQLTLPSPRRNPGGFDYKKYLAKSGISASIFALNDNIKIIENKNPNILINTGLILKHSIIKVINKSLPPEQAGLLNGMLIGYKDGLSKDLQEAFSDSGLSHVMAVSGMNVAFIILPFAFLFKKLRIGTKIANPIILIILLIFVCITGFSPPVMRAAIMAAVILSGQMLRREADVITSLSFAAIVLLVANPYNLFDIGFQLSFTATLSLILLYKIIKEKLTFKYLPGIITETLAVTIAAQIGVLPISTYYFNKIQLISPITNLLAVPLAGIITVLGFVMVLLGQINLLLSQLVGYINYIFLSFILLVTKTFSGIPFAVLKVITPTIPVILLYYATVIFFILIKPRYKIKIKPVYYYLCVFALIIVIIVKTLIPAELEVIFLDVGEGDSAFIKTYSGKTVLIDGGGSKPGTGSNPGETTVIPFLLDHGVINLDLVVATHGHDDHVQGLIPVVREMHTRNLAIPGCRDKTGLEKLIKAAQDNEYTKISECNEGDLIKIDDKTIFKVLYPGINQTTVGRTLNNTSLVLELMYRNVRILFTGDIEKGAEHILVTEREDLKADVLKIAHHGSSSSTGEEFLGKVNPLIAIISVGRNNFGHPSGTVLRRLARTGIHTYRTDLAGAVVLTTDGSKLKVRTTKK